MDIQTTLHQVLGDFQTHNWPALVLVLALVVRKWLSPESHFPYELSPNWRPIVFAFTGLVVTVVSTRNAGVDWLYAIGGGLAAGAASGFFDGLLSAIFGAPAKAPAWARWIVFVIDEVEGNGAAPPPAVGGGGAVVTPTLAEPAEKISMRRVALLIPAGMSVLFLAFLGCGGAQMTVQDGVQSGIETEQQRECVVRYADAGKAQVDACRAGVKATWNAYWAAQFDAGSNVEGGE